MNETKNPERKIFIVITETKNEYDKLETTFDDNQITNVEITDSPIDPITDHLLGISDITGTESILDSILNLVKSLELKLEQ